MMANPHSHILDLDKSLRNVFAEVRLGCQDCDDTNIVMGAMNRLLTVLETASYEEWGAGSTSTVTVPINTTNIHAYDAGAGAGIAIRGVGGDTVSRSIALFVRNVGVQHLHVRNILLLHLARLPDPLPFIEVIPALFSVAVSPGVVEQVARELQSMLQQDAKLLLPVIGALVDLPLPRSVVPQLARIAEGAMSIVDDADLPTLVRTLLKSLAILPKKRIVQSIRQEAQRLSDDALSLVVDAMWEVLPAAAHVCNVFMDCLAAEYTHGMGLYTEPALVDLAVVLILSSEAGLQRARARTLMTSWLQAQIFPFKQMHKILQRSNSNEVWKRMIPALWRASLWQLSTLALENEATLVGTQRAAHERARLGVQNLVVKVYAKEVPLREAVLTSLLSRCYANAASTSALIGIGIKNGRGDLTNRKRKLGVISLLPPLGKSSLFEGTTHDAQGKYFPRNSENSSNSNINNRGSVMTKKSSSVLAPPEVLQEERLAALAATVLFSLVWEFPEVGASVLMSISTRMHSSTEGRICLPAPAILNPLLACVAAASAVSPQMESTLLITLQKALAGVPIFDPLLGLVLGAKENTNNAMAMGMGMNTTYSGGWGIAERNGTMTMKNHLSRAHITAFEQHVYTPKAVGLLLAGHYLRRATLNAHTQTHSTSVSTAAGAGVENKVAVSQPFSSDRRAVISWVAQSFLGHSFLGVQGDCLVHTLDVLSSCLHSCPNNLLTESSSGSGSSSSRITSEDPEKGRLRVIVDSCLLCLERSFQLFFHVKAGNSLPTLATSRFSATSNATTMPLRLKLVSGSMSSHRSNLDKDVTVGTDKDIDTDPRREVNTVVWNVAGLARSITMQCVQASAATAAVASSSFWCMQRAATLSASFEDSDGSDNGSSAVSSKSSRLLMSITASASADGEIEIEGEREENEDGGVSPLIVSVGTLGWETSAGDADTFIFSTKRVGGNGSGNIRTSSADSIHHLPAEVTMQLAWEHALAAAVLLGQAQGQGEDYDENALHKVSAILSRIHSSRRYLRAINLSSSSIAAIAPCNQNSFSAEPIPGSNSSNSGSSSAGGGLIEGDSAGRSRGRPATVTHVHNTYGSSAVEGSAAVSSAMGVSSVWTATWQRSIVQRLLDRCVSMIEPPLLMAAVRTVVFGLKTDVGAEIHAQKKVTEAEVPAELMTSAGFATLSAFALQILTQRRREQGVNGLKAGEQDADEERRNEIWPGNFGSSSSSSSSSSRSPTPNSIFPSRLSTLLDTVDTHILLDDVYGSMQSPINSSISVSKQVSSASTQEDLLCRIFALMPALATITEQKRISDSACDSDIGSDSRQALTQALGPQLSRHGVSVLLLIVILLLEFCIQDAHAACSGNVDDLAHDEVLNKIAIALNPSVLSAGTATGIDAANRMGEEEDTENTCAHRMVTLFSTLEKSLLQLQDPTLVSVSIKTLATFAKGTLLTLRVARLSWEMLGALFTVHTDVSTGTNVGNSGTGRPSGSGAGARNNSGAYATANDNNIGSIAGINATRGLGLDALWPYLVSFTRAQPFFHFALSELTPFGRAGRAAAALVRVAFDRGAQKVTGASGSASVAGTGSFMWSGSGSPTSLAIRQLGAVWWVHEAPHNRLGGVACMLFQTLGGLYAPFELPGAYRFPGLTASSAEQHVCTALSLLPSLLILARPGTRTSAPKNLDVDASVNEKEKNVTEPYSEIISACKLFVWTMRELHAICAEGDPEGLYVRLLPLSVRVCRAQLEAVESAAAQVTHWRNSSHRSRGSANTIHVHRTLSSSGLSSSASASASASSTESRSADPGSLLNFKRVLQWTFSVSQWTQRHARNIQERLLAKNGSQQLRGLTRSVPLMSLQGERTSGRLHRLARTYGITNLEEQSLQSYDWEAVLWEKERSFRLSHTSTLEYTSHLNEESWQALSASEPDAPAMATSRSAWYEDGNEDSADEENEDDGEIDVHTFTGKESRAQSRTQAPEVNATAASVSTDADGYAYFTTSFASESKSGGGNGWGLYEEDDEEDEPSQKRYHDDDETKHNDDDNNFDDNEVMEWVGPGGGTSKRRLPQTLQFPLPHRVRSQK